MSLGEAHAQLGMLRKELDYNWPEVRREFDRALELNPTSPAVRLRNAISGLMPLGRVKAAVAELRSLLEADPLSPLTHWWLVVLLVLDRAVEVRDPWIMPIRTHPIFDPIRLDPRFQVLLRRMNLADATL